ncbi:phage tail protein [Amorphus orientalis]|uniref:Phage tail collar domain-containing protein n=1 Tax=Amorphus orientalis TaxID=649198 RepID=A0AAE3VND2_9HYPH|nr:phage tail protein [Amorphus orientalis]MDQ0314856.1 hypothetical protein [Amorphus orientalis]
MTDAIPSRETDYQADGSTELSVDVWNGVIGDIGARLRAREQLEASFAALEAQGIQASLDYIQTTVAPQLATLQADIQTAQDQIETIVQDGVAPNALKLEGHAAAYFATASALADHTGRIDNPHGVTKAQIGLGNVDDTPDADKPISDATQAALDALNGALEQLVPAGSLIWHASATTPTGYLKCNGAAVSRVVYSALFAAIGTAYGAGDGSTTFNVPDARGEFLRGLDEGRGVDGGRVLGSHQLDQFQGHYHQSINGASSMGSPLAPILGQGGIGIIPLTNVPIEGQHGSPRVGFETRPRNIAAVLYIKY